MLFDQPAYTNVICAGHLVDENSEKMSKSKGNVINPKEIINKMGIDAVRLQMCTVDVGNQKRFSEGLVREAVLPFLNVLSNVKTFYNQSVGISSDSKGSRRRKIEDKWIISKLNSMIKEVTENLDNYTLDKALLAIMDFVVNDFSRTYIKMTRDREDTKEIMGEVLEKVSLILAPYAPYISEDVYQLFSKESVHLSDWPELDKKKINKELEKEFGIILEVIEKGLAERDRAQIGLKWPLGKASIKGAEISDELKEIVKSQLNVKDVKVAKTGKEISVELDTKMTPELEAEGYGRVIARQIQALRKKTGLVKENKIKLGLDLGELRGIVESQMDFIKERVNAIEVEIEIKGINEKDYTNSSEEKIKGKIVHIFIKKV